MGPAETDGPRLVSHSSLPSRASRATNWPSRPPANNIFEAVVSTPPSVDGADMRKVHLRCLVFGSMAMMELNTSSVALLRPGLVPVKLWPSQDSGSSRRPALFIESGQPVGLDERRARQELAVRAVEHVEHAIAVRPHHDFAWTAVQCDVGENRNLRRIPVEFVVRRELVMPFELAGVGIDGDDGGAVEIVSNAV